MFLSGKVIFTIRNGLLGPPLRPFYCHLGLSRINCFSSLHNSQGSSWRDDIRAGVEGTSGMSDRDGAKDTIKDGMDREKERSGRDKVDATKDVAGSVADMAKEATMKAMETGLDLGEKAKQTLDIADATNETAKNVKDAGDGDCDDDKGRRLYENEQTDCDVERLRKRAEGHDSKH